MMLVTSTRYGVLVLTVDIALATRLVTEAARLANSIREADALETRAKTSVSDVVTEADLAAERFIVHTLASERPKDGLLGEEGTDTRGISGRRWIIDPVDGTYNFSTGSDYWCSALALTDGAKLLLGAVAHHASNTVLVGGPDLPTTRNGQALGTIVDNSITALGAATYAHPGFIASGPAYDAWARAARLPATIRMLGSGSMDLAGVATGRIGCWYQQGTPLWDWLPGAALVAGVGGAYEQIDAAGATWSVAGPPTAVAELTSALQQRR